MNCIALFLLQYSGFMGIKWFKDASPLGAALLFAVIAILAAILIILNIKKVGIGDTGIRLGKAAPDEGEGKPRKFSTSALRNIAHSYGLNSEQTKLLESIFRFEEVSNPAKVMASQSLVDQYFKEAYKRIERNSEEEETTQKQLSLLFSIRNAIDLYHTLTASPVPPKASGKATFIQRRFRRRQVGLRCGYYQVTMPDAGSMKKGAKMTVSGHQTSGSILDISVGGCAIQTPGAVKPGTYVKIEFQVAGAPGSVVLGQVLRINSSSSVHTMHTKFTKVPRKVMNLINALVFEYNTD